MATVPLIGVDCRFAATQSGVGRYTRELVRALLKRNDPWQYVLFVHNTSALDGILPHARCQVSGVRCQTYSTREHLEMPRAIRTSQVSFMHFPHFNTPMLCPVPFIATIHDLILHRFPNEASFPKRFAYRLLMRNTVKKAAHLIAVSNSTAADLAAMYGEDIRGKTSAIHEGIAEEFRPAPEHEKQRVRTKYHLPPRFLLYVGAAKEHKNVQTLIDASPVDLSLVLVTGGKEVERLKLRENVHILLNVPDEDLPALYSAALCYISPSLAEGFNFPVLEALACGCPVIATKVGSTTEVAGGFALLVEPTVEGLREGIRQMENGEWKMENGAIEHVRSFSWEKTAEQTATIYASTLAALSRADMSPRERTSIPAPRSGKE